MNSKNDKKIKFKKSNWVIFFALSTSNLFFADLSFAKDLIPAENSSFYYRIGGGQDVSMPANTSAFSTHLSVGNNIGLGYNCGVFNPTLSITNTLNDVKSSFENIDKQIVGQATAAIASFAMYELARSDPNMYNLLNNNLIGAHNLFGLSMKSCETMQSEAGKGENPFTDWVTVSMGNSWKKQMSLASGDSNNSTFSDLNQAKDAVEKDNGNSGVPWLGGQNAGGLNQPSIHVIHDTIIAGYNVQLGRNESDKSAPSKTDDNAHLIETWPDPETAALFVVSVVGDEEISTCSSPGCKKSTTPGLGLLPSNQKLAVSVTQKLQQIVAGGLPLNEQNLSSVSAPGVVVNTAIIRAIQNMSQNQQAIVTNKVGQDVATAKTIDQALLAKRLLQSGSQVPAIGANHPAQMSITRAFTTLDQDMQNLSFEVEMRRKVVSNTLSDILQDSEAQALKTQTTPSIPNNAPPIVQDGAVFKESSFKNGKK